MLRKWCTDWWINFFQVYFNYQATFSCKLFIVDSKSQGLEYEGHFEDSNFIHKYNYNTGNENIIVLLHLCAIAMCHLIPAEIHYDFALCI